MSYNKINNIFGWVAFLISTTVYVLTLEPSASYWDCGEFISAAYKMQIVHQPGAPLFLMLQNIFSNLALGDRTQIAYWMNFGSAVSSGLTILFLFWTITALAKKVVWPEGTSLDSEKLIRIIGAGLVGSLAYTFTDTFWFSAVESEVYAMSSLCTAVVFWAILKWDAHADEPRADRWLILIAYIMGLSIGVHLLNLLTIPALGLVVYFRRTAKPTSKGAIYTLLISVVILGIILWGIVQFMIKMAAYFDLFFVNSLGMGFGSGVLVFALLLIGGLTYGIIYSIKQAKPILNIALLATVFIIFGYGSFAMILIRAKANTSLNNSDPENAFSFLSYLNREQYGDEPLLKGPYFTSKFAGYEEGANRYAKGETKYEVIGQKLKKTYDKTYFFPRVYSDDAGRGHPQFYRNYLNLAEDQVPTFGDNMKFFFGYQVGYMYGRYLFWNFVGRQNDQKGDGNLTEGNWLSGIKPIDNMRLGGQEALPTSAKEDPSYNRFYFLPLILGLIGAFWHFNRRQKDAGIVGLLFFFTGIAIVLYLNQSPMQVRERDYAYAGSFYAFAIWIGLGVIGIADFLSKRKLQAKTAGIIATVVGLLAGPVILAKDGWDDHNRSTKYTARDLAKNYLESCAPNAILFTYGDNDTYPLWYVQEVENVRPDIRIVNLSLLSADWYVRQMKDKVNEAEPLPLSMTPSQFKEGTRDVIYFPTQGIIDANSYVPNLARVYNSKLNLKDVFGIMLSDNPNDKINFGGDKDNFLITQNLFLPINKEEVLQNKVVPKGWEDNIVDTISWKYSKGYVTRAELAMMDILVNNHWKRPIYFATTVPNDSYMGLDKYLVNEGFANRLMPVAFNQSTEDAERYGSDLVNVEALHKNVMEKFVWGNMHDAKYLDPESYMMLNTVISTFTTLSQSLIDEGRKEEAKQVLNKCLGSIPDKIYPSRYLNVNVSLMFLARQLYDVGEIEKGNALMLKNAQYIAEKLKYYLAIAETKPNYEMQSIQRGASILYNMAEFTKNAKQDKVSKQIDDMLNEVDSRFQSGSR
ncbi:glycosyltransferase family 117 protein [Olivibacter sitiensis]|uniref:glycosyltransferase family 117 protein n=1 Tax=Olivibacter sitiensis TaxID=376470 RepID=UPI00040AA5F9|nr:DUF2723 domain-containing protein [Olivibacter sitiensis]